MFEIFEVYNWNNERVFVTRFEESIPSKKAIETLIDDGHKIKVNNKVLYKKNIREFLKEIKTKEAK